MSTSTLELGCAHDPVDIELQEMIRAEEISVLSNESPMMLSALAMIQTSAAPTYFSWSHSGIPSTGYPYDSCSPNLNAIMTYFERTYPGTRSLGCHNQRLISGSSIFSTHAWGAAEDILFPNRTVGYQAVDFLIRNYVALGINTIHDYVTQKMWKPGLGWVSASIGSVGGQWFHVEVTPAAFLDGRSVELRITGFNPGPPTQPLPPPGVVYDPWHDHWGLFPVNTNKPLLVVGSGYAQPNPQAVQPYCTYLNHVMVFKAHQIVSDPFVVCTQSSIDATRNVRAFFDPQIKNVEWAVEAYKGQVGWHTWQITDGLATNFGAN